MLRTDPTHIQARSPLESSWQNRPGKEASLLRGRKMERHGVKLKGLPTDDQDDQTDVLRWMPSAPPGHRTLNQRYIIILTLNKQFSPKQIYLYFALVVS
ncbi:unnamed protein product [Pieris macdunnoughi]|uniref:Uncharacterized protein n=1 Tax=Pieris macdunnoughi TaxID=345717 RepID=A0A821W9S1_9NEOP|nr:unnamed protein product [Pieris macdunnoughi]